MAYCVTEVIDGDTFKVSPSWNTRGNTGDRVRIADVDARTKYAPVAKWPG